MPHFCRGPIRFYYQESSADGWPFVFQHGLGGDVTQPFGLFRPPAGVRLLAFDARGHGQTTPLGDPEQLCFKVFGEDLFAFFDHCGLNQVVLGGISMGAALALHFTLRWPERVRGLVLSRPAWLEAPCPWNVKMFTLISGLIHKHGAAEGLRLFQQTQDYLEALEQYPEVANSLSLQFQNPGIETTAVKLERLILDRPHPDRAAWGQVGVPTLVLGNRLDPIHPFEYAEDLAGAIRGSEFREITCKSVSIDQHGADVQRALEDFFQRHWPKG